MQVRHLDDDRSVADTITMAVLADRRPATVRLVCRGLRGPDGYDVDTCAALLDRHEGEVVLVTAAEAERYLGIAANRIYQWVFREQLKPADRIGRSPRYNINDLARLNGTSGR